MMKLSLSHNGLTDYVYTQFHNFFPDGEGSSRDLLKLTWRALERLEYCFSGLRLKGFYDNGPKFSHRHSDQYAIFLYYLANTAYREGNLVIADKAYALNKALHALDAFYEVELPDVFAVQHPVGTVLGRATYNNFFLVYHNCTVGASLNGDYPSFGNGVVMYGGSRIIGNTKVGDNTLVSTGAIVMDAGELPPNSILHGISPHHKRSQSRRDAVNDIFYNFSREHLADMKVAS